MTTKTRTVKAWVLTNGDTFIAALRFKPKRVYQKFDDIGYYVWTDCDGPRFHQNKWFVVNAIAGSMNAKCHEVTITYSLPIKNKRT